MHTRIRKFNTRTTYPEQKLDNDLCQTVVASGRMVFVRGQVGQDLDTSANVGVGDAAAVLDATGVADASVLDGVGVAARAVPAAPLEITKRPVARPSVTGRAYADRMRTPCLVSCDCWECALRNVVSSLGYGLPLGQERSHSTLIPALNATPRDRLVSFCFQFVTQS